MKITKHFMSNVYIYMYKYSNNNNSCYVINNNNNIIYNNQIKTFLKFKNIYIT